jgi:colicin import membrane protein
VNPKEQGVATATFKRYKVNENGSAEYRQDGSTISFRCSADMFDGKAPESIVVALPEGAAFAAVNSAKLEAEKKRKEREDLKAKKAKKKAADDKAKAKADATAKKTAEREAAKKAKAEADAKAKADAKAAADKAAADAKAAGAPAAATT